MAIRRKMVAGEFTLSNLTKFPRADIHIKLGANKGSGFVFCGSAKDIDFDKIDADICDAYRQTIKNAEVTIKSIEERGKTYDDYKNYVKRRNSSVTKGKKTRATEQGYQRWLSGMESRVKSAGKTKEKTKRKLESFTTLRDRKLVEFFASITEDNTFVFVYEGEEAGDIWTTAEYVDTQRKNERRKKLMKKKIAAGA